MLNDTLISDNSLGIFLSETWLTNDILDAEVNINGLEETGLEGLGEEQPSS